MVDVGVGEEDEVEIGGRKWEGLAVGLAGLRSLVQAAVHEELDPVGAQVKAAARHGSGRAQKTHFHRTFASAILDVRGRRDAYPSSRTMASRMTNF